jgi:hypothetical protein
MQEIKVMVIVYNRNLKTNCKFKVTNPFPILGTGSCKRGAFLEQIQQRLSLWLPFL